VLSGLDQHGNPFTTMLTDAMGAGCGAAMNRDGVDTGGILGMPMSRMPDVEMTEFSAPLLYLWRREEPDSGGPGKFRGGVTASLALVPHGTEVPMAQVISGAGKAVSQNIGAVGGYPGNSQLDVAVRGAEVRRLLAAGTIPSSIEEMGGVQEILSCEEEAVLGPNDAHIMFWQGGGGYGDPLLRSPDKVATDVVEMRVSETSARDIYGVVLRDLAVDEAATEAQRADIRSSRRELARNQEVN
jgi:N-methylhydantoinase B